MFLNSCIRKALSKARNCIKCHDDVGSNNATFVTCSHCRIAVYCSEDCKEKDTSHRHVCRALKRATSACNESGILYSNQDGATRNRNGNGHGYGYGNDNRNRNRNLNRSFRILNATAEEIANRGTWNHFVKILWKEALRPSIQHHAALELLFIVLKALLEANAQLYLPAAILLPEVLTLMEDYAGCHELLIRGKMHFKPSSWIQFLRHDHNRTVDERTCYCYTILDAPLDIDDDGPISCICVFHLIFVKLRLKGMLEALWFLDSLQCGISFHDLDQIASYLGLPSKWQKVLPDIVERQCMDLIKLLFKRNSTFVPALLGNIGLLSAPNVDVASLSSMDALRNYLVIRQLLLQKSAVQFFTSVAADIPKARMMANRR